VVIATLVLGWSVFVKRDVVAPVLAPAVEDNDTISNDVEDNVNDDISEVDTLDYKTYRNEIIGIEFEYPRDWDTLKPDDMGDTMKDSKRYNSFVMNLPDASYLAHTLLNYENMPIDAQYEAIKC